jgi:hypothetical protein
VGGADEEPGKTGLAHFLEHMAFKGTETLGTKDFKKEKPILEEIERVGEELASEYGRGAAAEAQKIKELRQKLKDLQIETTSVKITQGTYLLIVGNYQKTLGNQKDLKLAFLLTGNHLQELASLQLILQRNKIDLKSIESIDLRFDKPIVVYMNGKR